jgi:hypothetical protein
LRQNHDANTHLARFPQPLNNHRQHVFDIAVAQFGGECGKFVDKHRQIVALIRADFIPTQKLLVDSSNGGNDGVEGFCCGRVGGILTSLSAYERGDGHAVCPLWE